MITLITCWPSRAFPVQEFLKASGARVNDFKDSGQARIIKRPAQQLREAQFP
jgi:hypothetical protein